MLFASNGKGKIHTAYGLANKGKKLCIPLGSIACCFQEFPGDLGNDIHFSILGSCCLANPQAQPLLKLRSKSVFPQDRVDKVEIDLKPSYRHERREGVRVIHKLKICQMRWNWVAW